MKRARQLLAMSARSLLGILAASGVLVSIGCFAMASDHPAIAEAVVAGSGNLWWLLTLLPVLVVVVVLAGMGVPVSWDVVLGVSAGGEFQAVHADPITALVFFSIPAVFTVRLGARAARSANTPQSALRKGLAAGIIFGCGCLALVPIASISVFKDSALGVSFSPDLSLALVLPFVWGICGAVIGVIGSVTSPVDATVTRRLSVALFGLVLTLMGATSPSIGAVASAPASSFTPPTDLRPANEKSALAKLTRKAPGVHISRRSDGGVGFLRGSIPVPSSPGYKSPSPISQVRSTLIQYAPVLTTGGSELPPLEVDSVVRRPSETVIDFVQTANGIPIHNGRLIAALSHNEQAVTAISNGLKPPPEGDATEQTISGTEAASHVEELWPESRPASNPSLKYYAPPGSGTVPVLAWIVRERPGQRTDLKTTYSMRQAVN